MTDSLKYSPESAHPTDHAGLFIAFEGGDGAGKSTQVSQLAATLRDEGYEVLTTREPGGSEIGEKLRSLVLEHGNGTIDARTEALIFAAARAAHAEQVIRPSIEAGKIVLCDRYIDSSAAYQGTGRGLGIENITNLSLWATKNLVPDLTVLIDVPLSAGRSRTTARGAADRMESESDQFHSALHETFGALAQKNSARYAVVDGTQSIEAVHANIYGAVHQLLKGHKA
ncbi:MAG: dTMP kinase [Rothia sp. (in: high G+C Gram-positive bacteria)]|nr:dTMP kinase [Rothia sp. (in: high G+C Gram-positive bacteria)]